MEPPPVVPLFTVIVVLCPIEWVSIVCRLHQQPKGPKSIRENVPIPIMNMGVCCDRDVKYVVYMLPPVHVGSRVHAFVRQYHCPLWWLPVRRWERTWSNLALLQYYLMGLNNSCPLTMF